MQEQVHDALDLVPPRVVHLVHGAEAHAGKEAAEKVRGLAEVAHHHEHKRENLAVWLGIDYR